MVKVTHDNFDEQKFYLNQGKDFIERLSKINDDKVIEALGRLVHDLPKNMSKFKRDRLVATHHDHEVFNKLCIDVTFVMRKAGTNEL